MKNSQENSQENISIMDNSQEISANISNFLNEQLDINRKVASGNKSYRSDSDSEDLFKESSSESLEHFEVDLTVELSDIEVPVIEPHDNVSNLSIDSNKATGNRRSHYQRLVFDEEAIYPEGFYPDLINGSDFIDESDFIEHEQKSENVPFDWRKFDLRTLVSEDKSPMDNTQRKKSFFGLDFKKNFLNRRAKKKEMKKN